MKNYGRINKNKYGESGHRCLIPVDCFLISEVPYLLEITKGGFFMKKYKALRIQEDSRKQFWQSKNSVQGILKIILLIILLRRHKLSFKKCWKIFREFNGSFHLA